MIKQSKLKKFRLKYLKFIYTQTELLALMPYLRTRENTKASYLYKSETVEKAKELISYIDELQIIQRKVKTRLAVNNILFNMNKRIFLRDDLGRKKDILSKFSEGKHTDEKKEVFKDFKPLYIETIISDAGLKRKKISKLQSRRNRWIPSFIFRNSLVLKDFEKQRALI